MKTLFRMVVIGLMLLFIPLVAFADPVSWSSENYTASVFMELYGSATQSGSPLPISANVGSRTSRAEADISDAQMYTFAALNYTDTNAVATTSFSGTYTSLASSPLFQFTYSLYYGYSSDTPYSYPDGTYAWLTIIDNTDNNNILYSNNLLPLTSSASTISVNTIPGHTMSVDFGTLAWTDTYYPNHPTTGGYGYQTLTLNYSTATAVAPEPISSILFITGGTLLAGRRFIRRQA